MEGLDCLVVIAQPVMRDAQISSDQPLGESVGSRYGDLGGH
jgi:hypothetical protein